MTEWLNSGLWLCTGMIILIVLRIYRSVIVQDFPSADPKTPHTVYRILQSLVLCIALSSGLLSAPLATDHWYSPQILTTLLVVVWTGFCTIKLYTVKGLTNNRLGTLACVGVISAYIMAITWNYLPAPLRFISWFRELPTEWQSVTAIVSGTICAALFHTVILPITNRLTQNTASGLDDSILEIVRWPLSVSIAFIGIGHAITTSLLSEYWVTAFHGLSLSLLIGMWTRATLKGNKLVLEHFLSDKDRWLVVNERTLPIFQLLLRISIITMSVYLLLLVWEINIMLWITSAGVVGIAVAYASQDTLSSLFSGVAILSDAPYKLHDFLVLDNQTRGRVTHIGFRSTRLLTTENIEIIIPNSIMANAQIINMSGGETSIARIEIAAGVAYGSDIEHIRTLLLDITHKLDHVILDNPRLMPVAHFTSMGASSLDFTVRLWISNPEHILKIQDQANTLIYTTFTAHGIEIPYTKQDVYMYSMGSPT